MLVTEDNFDNHSYETEVEAMTDTAAAVRSEASTMTATVSEIYTDTSGRAWGGGRSLVKRHRQSQWGTGRSKLPNAIRRREMRVLPSPEARRPRGLRGEP